ncbi:nucleotidyltransferase [Clostridium perfringens]|uniref:nucleotide-binding domain-containing protein n=1 Tax=Clostridium perfringens TaxID=1502 RepID=UPI002247C970|nr:nucleotidyltransferase [Clostridium perfringens]MCX0361617.1 nucleotidyltransferase [Clostridium perfringens]MDM0830531.1 nucleotidyltransferase [Clostridium perfringens]
MYNLNSKFNTFYSDKVILKSAEVKRLRELKKLNLERLKEGLKLYNKENNTNYKIAETLEQGSVAMGTVTQNEENDYDIDVAIVFEKGTIPEGTTATKNIIVNALNKKCINFKTPPESKTNCVRIVYAEGYHIDFAIYRRFKNDNDDYEYEHCGSEWRERNPRAITKWFLDSNKEKNYNLRKIVRLLKMFCKSNSSWVMPGGLIQSVLADEKYIYDSRLDKMFYNILVQIKTRLDNNKEIINPTDSTKSLLLVSKDDKRISNLHSRLENSLKKLDVLFSDSCTESDAIKAWSNFFNHEYWDELLNESSSRAYSVEKSNSFEFVETEEFIEYLFPVDIKYDIKLDCKVIQDGFLKHYLSYMLQNKILLKPNLKLEFEIRTINVPKPYDIYWKIRNKGDKAKEKNCIRGQIIKTNEKFHKEETQFKGEHYVECYIVKNNVCVAMDRIYVPINI